MFMADLEEITELTLGLPGGGGRRERAAPPSSAAAAAVVSVGFNGGNTKSKSLINHHKRGFVVSDDGNGGDGVDLDLLSSNINGRSSIDHVDDKLEFAEATSQAPAKKAQAIGWPPVRSFRKKVFTESCDCKYVKVAADGAPYLRKVNLETYSSYQELLTALEDMFFCFNIPGNNDQGKIAKFQVKGMVEYVPTYEDKDGDLMLVGDVPWKMFTESCKRIRLMKSAEAVGLAPRTTQDMYTQARDK